MDKSIKIYDDETLDDLQLNNIYIIQKKKGFRFGVDAVLLANYANIKKHNHVIDLCSGTGIIPILLAGKTCAEDITGIEIQNEMVEMANRSVLYDNLQDRVNFVSGDITDDIFMKNFKKYDVVTVNPPYKKFNSGIINPNDKEAIARHEICVNLEGVIKACKIVMNDSGRMYMVHRPERLADIFCLMRKYKIEPKRIKMVYPSPKKRPNIVLIEGQNYGGEFLKWEAPLYVYNEDGKYSDEINQIYSRK